ncbi:MAG: hypothetical protein IT447_09230 [Phycisphaerales bacterium]|jgi:hypothetical protein|nr:hypothetical protein [Phycisphaerales bacterium]
MTWDKQRIVRTIKQLYRAGKKLSYNAMTRSNQPLLSAAAYHFGSWRKAIESADIDYAQVLRRPRWTRQLIIKLIKTARRNGEDLNWSAVTRRRDELGKASFASLQPRLFGTWDRALHAAGLDAADVSCYRRWSRNDILFDLREMHQAREPLNSGTIQRDDPGLHAAAVRYFGSYDDALKAARIKPDAVRLRQSWTTAQVKSQLRALGRRKKTLSSSLVRREHPALYGAAIRHFGTFAKARKAAGLKKPTTR